jgi:hypothetical protein
MYVNSINLTQIELRVFVVAVGWIWSTSLQWAMAAYYLIPFIVSFTEHPSIRCCDLCSWKSLLNKPRTNRSRTPLCLRGRVIDIDRNSADVQRPPCSADICPICQLNYWMIDLLDWLATRLSATDKACDRCWLSACKKAHASPGKACAVGINR